MKSYDPAKPEYHVAGAHNIIQSEVIDQAIIKLAIERGADKTICPSEVARHIGGQDDKDWRPLMVLVRERAMNLAWAGRIDIKKGGEPVDPNDFSGVYRIAISD